MWPIVKKEVRENARYLIAAFVIILLILDLAAHNGLIGWTLLGFWTLLGGQPDVDVNNVYRNPNFNPFLGTWGFLCFLLAGVIALAQVYQEQRRKTWPLLAHLPISRSRMIFGKLLAGLLMYLMVCLPLALLIIVRLNTRGVGPGPVYLYMFFPLPAYFLPGAMFYLATFLAAFRPGRWYATKWLPLLTAIPIYIAAIIAGECLNWPFFFWQRSKFELCVLLGIVALVPLCLALVPWAIREQARTREY